MNEKGRRVHEREGMNMTYELWLWSSCSVLKLGTGVGFLAACATALAFRFDLPERAPSWRPASATGSQTAQGEGCH